MDSLQRKQFCCDVEHDFSVIAPAGVGKTFSIVERIYSIADKMPEELSHLHVITYTKKAAESLQKRALERIKQHPKFNQLAYFFNQSFFGTIHSLCWTHIRKFDSANYELLLDDSALKESFLFSYTQQYFDDEAYKKVLRFIDLDVFLKVIDNVLPASNEIHEGSLDNVFSPDLSAIYNYKPEPRNLVAITKKQKEIQSWESHYDDENLLPLPECLTGGEKFKQVFHETFEPFFAWLGENAYKFAKKLAQDYFNYRLANGVLKHSDLIFRAKNLLKEQKVQDLLKRQKISVLLDEAQDTDVVQFQYLQALCSINSESRFSMVGDPQQSIYSRADLQYYLSLHKALIREGKCKELVFSQTFRCPKSIVRILNNTFPRLLNSEMDDQQVDYVELVSASKLVGQYQEIEISKPSLIADPVNHELQQVVNFLRQYQQEKRMSGADICLLCPRNDWLNEAQTYFLSFGISLQLYSNNATFRNNRFFCAILAFVHLLNFPDDSFEIAGILQGIFHLSEKEITLYPNELQIASKKQASGEINVVLSNLVELRDCVLGKTPWQGVLEMMHFFGPHCPESITNTSSRNIILEVVAQSQQLGQTWIEIEKKLYQYLDNPIECTTAVLPNAIQGYSCYKAKGLEWDTVVIPFFYRPIRHHTMQYPCIFKNKLIFNKNAKNFAHELYLSRKRELQRLLYVACTRAKRNLIIMKDKALWKSEENAPSFGDLLEESSYIVPDCV